MSSSPEEQYVRHPCRRRRYLFHAGVRLGAERLARAGRGEVDRGRGLRLRLSDALWVSDALHPDTGHDFPGYIGGFGQYRHYARAATPADLDIVTPNNDTTYSWAWLDLRREPIVFQTPDIDEGRYNVFQWVDLYTHIFASPGSRLTGKKGGTYMLAGPDWTGKTPEGIDKVFQAETNFVGRYPDGNQRYRRYSKGPGIQRGYQFTPLSAYMAEKPPAPSPELDFPVWHEELAKGPAFIGYLNFLLGHAKPNPADTNALKRFAAIGIGPGKPFDAAKLDKETAAAIKAGIDAALKKLNAASRPTRTISGCSDRARSQG